MIDIARPPQVRSTESGRPFAYTDPRALSQAWYDNLHPKLPVAHAAPVAATLPESATPAARHTPDPGATAQTRERAPSTAPALLGRTTRTNDRVAPAPAAAVARERLATFRSASARAADAVATSVRMTGLALPHGRADVLIAQIAQHLRIDVVVRSGDRTAVAGALARASRSLAARGIACSLHVH